MIREAFSDMLVSVEDLKMTEKQMADSIFKKIRERFIHKVRKNGPTKTMIEAKQNRFIDIMIDLCDEGELSQMKRKISELIGKFARKVEGYKSLYGDD